MTCCSCFPRPGRSSWAWVGTIRQPWHCELEEQFRRFHDRLTFVWFDALSFPEILRRSASLPDNSAIYYVTFGTDATGAAYAPTFTPRRMRRCLPRTACTWAPASSADRYCPSTISVAEPPTSPFDCWTERPRTASNVWRRPHGSRSSTGASLSDGASPRAGCHRAASCAIALRACGAHTGPRCSARRRAGRPIAPDRGASVSAPRTAAG